MTALIIRRKLEQIASDEAVTDYMLEMLQEIEERTRTEEMGCEQILSEIRNALMFLDDQVQDSDRLANDIMQTMLRSDGKNVSGESDFRAQELRPQPRDSEKALVTSSPTHVANYSTAVAVSAIDTQTGNSAAVKPLDSTSTTAPFFGAPKVDLATGRAILNSSLENSVMSKEERKRKKKKERAERFAKKKHQPSQPATDSGTESAGPALVSTKENHHTISVTAEQMERAALLDAEVMSSNDGRLGIVEGADGSITEGVIAGAWRGEVHGAAAGDSKEICVHQLTLTYGPDELLTQTVLRLHYGMHYGLIGRNGTGKTTLLRRLAAHQIPGIARKLRVHLVQQEALPIELSALESVKSSDVRKAALEAEVDRLMDVISNAENESVSSQASTQLKQMMDKLSVSRTAEEEDLEARNILSGLGFTPSMIDTPTNCLSGGWRMRLALAQGLFIQPDVLLLDEPTNHLDLEGIIWLQEFLNGYEGTVVVVSHDRAFLDAVVEETIHIHQRQLKYYPGNYSAFEQAREDKIKKMDRLQGNLDRKKEHMTSSIDKMSRAASVKNKNKVISGGTKLHRAKGDEKKLKQVAQRKLRLLHVGIDQTEDGKKFNGQKHSRRLGSAADNAGGWKNGKMTAGSIREHVDPAIRFSFSNDTASSKSIDTAMPLLQIREISFRWDEDSPLLFHKVDLSLSQTSRIGLLGSNGSGKTTFLNLIHGKLSPTDGAVLCPPTVRLAMFAQHHVDELQLERTPIEHMQAKFELSEQNARAELSAFGIHPDLANRPMKTLSGGQLSRVVFSDLNCRRPQILLLDEPTNFLDMDSRQALKDALHAYQGGIILISHDQDLLREVCDEFWLVTGNEFPDSPTGLEVLYDEEGFDNYIQILHQR